MGLNLRKIAGGIFNNVRDVFDANTAEDQRKRMAAGQARMYQDQQRQLQAQRQQQAQQKVQQVQRQAQQIQNVVRNPVGAAYNAFAKPAVDNYFKPDANKVRIRDVAREIPGAAGQVGDFAKSMLKPFGETADYVAQSGLAAVSRNNEGLKKARDESYQQSFARPAARVTNVVAPYVVPGLRQVQETQDIIAQGKNQKRVDDLVAQSRQIKNDRLSGKVSQAEADKRFAAVQKEMGNSGGLDRGTQKLKDLGAINPDGTEKTGLETGLGVGGDFLTLYTLGRNPLSGAGLKEAAKEAGTTLTKQALKEIGYSNILNTAGQVATGVGNRQSAGDIAKDVALSAGVNTAAMGLGYGYNAAKGGANTPPPQPGTYLKGSDGKLAGSTPRAKVKVTPEAQLQADAMAPQVSQLEQQVINNPTPANKAALRDAQKTQLKLLNGDKLSVNETNALYEAGVKKKMTPIEAMNTPEMQKRWAEARRQTRGSGKVTKTSSNLYHTTSAENLDSITKNGLTTGNKQRFEGVGSTDRISFGANEKTAAYYGKQGDVMIRTKSTYRPANIEEDLLAGGRGAYTVGDNVPPSELEVKINGKWQPLIQGKAKVRPVAETNALMEQGKIKAKVANNTGESFDTAPRITTPDAPAEVPARDGGLKWTQKFSPDRIIRENVTQPIEQAVNRGIFKLETSQNKLARGIGRTFQGFSREAGLSPEALQARHAFSGQGQYGKLEGDITTQLGKDFTPESKARVYAALDPDQAAALGMKKPKNLTSEEKILFDQLDAVRRDTTDKLLAAELITPEQAANKSYLKREYSIFMDDPGYQQGMADTKGFLKKRKAGISDEVLDTAITDPAYLAGKHQAEAQQALAVVDYSNKLAEMGYVSDKPLKGYSQLPNTKLYGPAAGKWVPQSFAEDFTGFQYNSAMMSAVNDVLNAYDSLGVRKAKKELLTIFNPAVRLGNQATNRAVFSQFGGINPVQFNKEYLRAGSLIKNNSQYYKEAVQQGLMGTDITMADFGKRLLETTGDEGIARKGAQWAEKSYSGADDKAKLTAYKIWRDRGYSPEKAYSLTQRAFQDYRSVGFFYDLAAKTPLIGNAFVRFAGDAVRIAKNNAVDHPIRSAATIAMWANFVNIMSKLSGETPEDKQTREDRFGAPKVPFTDISLTVQTPVGEVNLARFMPQYQLNDIGNPLSRALPIGTSPLTLKDGKVGVNSQGLQDPLLGQIAQVAIDQDFRGKSIRDPENTIDELGNKKFNDQLPGQTQAANVARFLGTQNIPLGREADTILSSAMGVKDIYGKERSLPQAIGRAAGIKVEQFGPEQAKKQRSMNTYYDERAKINEELKTLPKSAQDAFKRATGYYKLREKVPNEFAPGEERYKKEAVYNFPEDKWRDYAQNPQLYDIMLKKKVQEAKTNGSPLQPQFDKTLSEEFRKQLIQNKAMAPGDDVEADERMYSSSEWDKYQELQKAYEEKAKKYYPEGEFTDELVKHKTKDFPKKGAAKEAYDKAYAAYNAGKGPKPTFTDAVAADKDAYTEAKRQWTNDERKARGLAPISKEMWNNVTFGYESDEEKVYKQLKYGKGYGGYGKGGYGGKSAKAANPDKYRISTKAKTSVAKAKFGKPSALAKVKISNAGLTKAKVATRKSRV